MEEQKQKKVNKEKTSIPKAVGYAIGIILWLLILGGIGIGIYYLIKLITFKWFIFAILIPLIPFGIVEFKKLVFSKGQYSLEQSKQANISVCVYTLFCWLCDLFYMAFLIDSLMLKFIFGGLIMIIIFYNLSVVFINERVIFKWGLIQDFISGIALSVYLIYIIPNESLQSIIIPIVAGVYGGLLTLVGVAWTIRKGDERRKEDRNQLEQDRKEEERKKAIPYIKVEIYSPAYNKHIRIKDLYSILDNEVYKECDGNVYYSISINNFAIKNISSNPVILYGVKFKGVFYEFETSTIIEQGGICNIVITANSGINSTSRLNDLFVVLKDIIGNQYKIQCKYSMKHNNMYCKVDHNGIDYTVYPYIYTVEDVSIPVLIIGETKDEKAQMEGTDNA